jgi:hypothetical protein
VFTNHSSLCNISKQSDIATTTSTQKLNLRLVLASEYLSRFNLDVHHKPGKANVILDTLSRLSTGTKEGDRSDDRLGELDVLSEAYYYTVTLVKIDPTFKKSIVNSYSTDPKLSTIVDTVTENAKLGDNLASLPFDYTEDGLLF